MKSHSWYLLVLAVSSCIVLSCSPVPVEEQEEAGFASLKGAYFGQPSPGDAPQLFLSGTVSSCRHREYCISFLQKGTVCVFGREDLGAVYTFIKDGHWTEPQSLNLDMDLGEWKHTAGPDDRTLYFMSPRLTDSDDVLDEVNIFSIEWTGNGWTDQKPLPTPPNSPEYHQIYPSFSRSGTAYFHGGEYWHTENINDDIFYCEYVDGKYLPQQRLPEPINSEFGEFDAFIAPDESYLLFHSNRPGSYGSFDIYVCFRTEDGTWTDPVNLGPSINSPGWESCVNVTPDGKFLFFVSGRHNPLCDQEADENTHNTSLGFYWVETSFLQELKLKAVEAL